MRAMLLFQFAICLLVIKSAEDGSVIDDQKSAQPKKTGTPSSPNVFTNIIDWITWGSGSGGDSSTSEELDSSPECCADEPQTDNDLSLETSQNVTNKADIPDSTQKEKLILILPCIFAALLLISIIGLYVNKRRHTMKLMNSIPVDPEVITVTSVVAPYGKI